MSTALESSKRAMFRRAMEAVNNHDWAVISATFDEIFAPDLLLRTPVPLQTTGVQAVKEVFATLLRAFPDLHVEVEDSVEEGDMVAVRNTVTGTHQGEYMGVAPTGTPVTYQEMFFVRFAGGRIAETWGVVDVLAQMKQLGVIHA
jgi:predicted ester cyclase